MQNVTNEVTETLAATLDGDKRSTHSKDYLVYVTVDVPYPKQFEYRQSATGIAPAVARSLREVRKSLKGKRIKEYRIRAIQF